MFIPNGAANPFSSFGPFSSSFIEHPVLSPMVGCKHPPQYFSGTDRASQETAISGFCQQAFVGIHNSIWVWWLYMEFIPRWGSLWMVIPSVSAAHFVSVAPSMGILLPLLRLIEVPTLWSSWVSCGLWTVSWVFQASGLISTDQWVHPMCVILWLCYLSQDDILQIHLFA